MAGAFLHAIVERRDAGKTFGGLPASPGIVFVNHGTHCGETVGAKVLAAVLGAARMRRIGAESGTLDAGAADGG